MEETSTTIPMPTISEVILNRHQALCDENTAEICACCSRPLTEQDIESDDAPVILLDIDDMLVHMSRLDELADEIEVRFICEHCHQHRIPTGYSMPNMPC
jgi:uncharacterized Fe-S cluster-containing protein